MIPSAWGPTLQWLRSILTEAGIFPAACRTSTRLNGRSSSRFAWSTLCPSAFQAPVSTRQPALIGGALKRRSTLASAPAGWLAQNWLESSATGSSTAAARTHEMHAYVVMPNHVLVLATFRQDFRLSDVVRGWKSFSARRINASLGRNGALWQRDYFDRYMRDEIHFERVRRYIEMNPVIAGLTEFAGKLAFQQFQRIMRSVGLQADVNDEEGRPPGRRPTPIPRLSPACPNSGTSRSARSPRSACRRSGTARR